MRNSWFVALMLTLIGVLSAASAGCARVEPTAGTADVGIASLTSTSWPMMGHDAQHTNRSEAVGPAVPVRKWSLVGDGEPEPSIGPDGTLYLGAVNGVPGAVDPSDGTIKWRMSGNKYSSVPAVVEDGLVVMSNWSNGVVKRPYVFAVDGSGHTVWRTWLGEGVPQDMVADSVGVGNPVIGPDGTIYVSASVRGTDGPVYAIDPSNGSILWAFSAVAVDFQSPVVALDGTIYALGFYDGGLFAIRPDGTKKWSYAVGGYGSEPAVGTDGTVYVLDETALLAIGPDGHQKWKHPIEAQGGISIARDGTLYVVSEGLFAISSDGRSLWSAKTEGHGTAMVDGAGTIYVQNGAGWLYAVNPDGSVKWRFRVGDPTEAMPVMGPDGTIYCGVSGSVAELVAVGSAAGSAQ